MEKIAGEKCFHRWRTRTDRQSQSREQYERAETDEREVKKTDDVGGRRNEMRNKLEAHYDFSVWATGDECGAEVTVDFFLSAFLFRNTINEGFVEDNALSLSTSLRYN